tara:strand:- start:529 stop:681 length:153 start_codon:yes stop_codon:yes gene_type:complete
MSTFWNKSLQAAEEQVVLQLFVCISVVTVARSVFAVEQSTVGHLGRSSSY